MDRRYSQCRHNDYWIALHIDRAETLGGSLVAFCIKRKLQDHYGPTRYAMFSNPCPWYNEYKNYGKDEVIYLRDEGMLTFLQLSGALDYESN